MEKTPNLDEKFSLEEKLLPKGLPEEYDKIIDSADFIEKTTPYVENLHDYELHSESICKLFTERFNNGTVVDLGCADSTILSGFLLSIGVSKYIGVDLAPQHFAGRVSDQTSDEIDKDLNELDNDLIVSEQMDENISNVSLNNKIESYEDGAVVLIKGDMLDTVSRMEDEFVNGVVVSGIELAHSDMGTQYTEALTLEISRILKNGGVVVVYHSDVVLDGELYENITPTDSGDNLSIYLKRQ